MICDIDKSWHTYNIYSIAVGFDVIINHNDLIVSSASFLQL